jgi:hypothetical protein
VAELEVASPLGVAEVPMPAEVEVPLGSGAAEVPISAKVEVPLGSSAAVVPMAVAEPGGGKVLYITPDSSRFPDSSKFHTPSLACPTILHVLHTQTNNKPYII